MPRRYKLTWFRQRKCWSKWYRGKRYYVGTGGKCRGKSDIEGYGNALDEWVSLKDKIDNPPPVPEYVKGIIDDQHRSEPEAALPLPNLPTPDLATAVGFASDYSSLPTDLAALNGAVNETTVEGLMKAYLKEKKADAKTGQISPKMFAEYSAKLDDFLKFAKHYERERIGQIDSDLLAAYRQEQLRRTTLKKAKGGTSKYTARKRLQAIKRFVEWCYKCDALETLPRVLMSDFAKLKLDAPQPTFYTPAEIKKLYNIASPLLKASILCGLNCGYTQADVSSLTWNMIDPQTRIVDRKRQKTGTVQRHRLWPLTLKVLREVSKTKSGLILTGPKGLALVREEIGADGKLKLYDQIANEFRKAKRLLKWTSDSKGFKHLRKSSSNNIAKHYQDKPYLTDQFLAHSVQAMKKHYVAQHFDELYAACDYLDTVYKLSEAK